MSFAGRAWAASAALIVGLLLAVVVSGARAGVWVQVACVNPNGTAAPSAGWTGFTTGSGFGASANSACAPGTPMTASLGAATPAPVFTSAGLMYTPPLGSTLVGGSLRVVLSANGHGSAATSVAEIDEPAQTASDARMRCTAGSRSCGSSATNYSGTFSLRPNLGGNLYVVAGCTGTAGFACDEAGRSGSLALAQVSSAALLLQNVASPSATRFHGTLLGRAVHGTARLSLHASDPGGPGVYRIAVTIDGRTVHDGTPSRNGGACVPAGTASFTGVLEFDSPQPCPTSLTASLRIPTAKLPDGSHRLAVSVTDAAGNATTVLRRTIGTDNPQLTPRPAHGPRARLKISWRWTRTITELRAISASGLPSEASLAVACSGSRCPTLPAGPRHGRAVRSLLRRLRGARFQPGDALLVTVTVPRRPAERIRLAIRRSARPQVRLLAPSHR